MGRRKDAIVGSAWANLPLGRCDVHGKMTYTSKSRAKGMIRYRYADDPGIRAYRCDAIEGMWHIGHLPRRVIQGQRSRESIINRRFGDGTQTA